MRTHLTRRIANARSDDEGAILVFALVIVLVSVVFLTGALSFAQSGLTTSVGYRFHNNTTNYTDGVMDGAINSLRSNPALGSASGTCPTFTPATPPASDLGASTHAYTVTCQPATPTSGGAPPNQPAYAVMTLMKDSSGSSFTVDKNSTLTVDGSIYSNGQIVGTSGASLQDFGNITATDTCNLPVTATGKVSCSSGNPSIGDPGYAAAVDTSNAPLSVLPACSGQSVPYGCVDPKATCASAGSVISFSPGLYTEVPAAPTGCNGTVWWFQPGVYYFDFQQGGATWNVGNDVVGGTPNGFSASSTSVSFPGACDQTSANGVQFILGGASNISVPTGQNYNFEICAPTSSTSQEIALYGLSSGDRATTGPTDLKPGSVSSTTSPAYAPAPPASSLQDALSDIDTTKLASASLNANQTAAVTLTNYNKLDSGSNIAKVQGVVLRIVHAETTATPTVTAALGSGSVPAFNPRTASFCTHTALTAPLVEDDCDITNDLPTDYSYSALDGSTPLTSVTYSARGNAIGSASLLDGINIQVKYQKPGFEASSCTVASGCEMFSDGSGGGGGNPKLTLLFHGTVYAPTATLEVVIQTASLTVFDRGVVCGTLVAHISSSSTQTVAPFALPKATSGRSVLFTANVDGVPKLRALVTYTDYQPNPTYPDGIVAFPGFGVAVTDWSVLR